MTAPFDQDDVVIARLLQEAQREFPRWQFRRAGESWVAVRGEVERTAATIAELRAWLRTEAPGWRVWRSDVGRWWATREAPRRSRGEGRGVAHPRTPRLRRTPRRLPRGSRPTRGAAP